MGVKRTPHANRARGSTLPNLSFACDLSRREQGEARGAPRDARRDDDGGRDTFGTMGGVAWRAIAAAVVLTTSCVSLSGLTGSTDASAHHEESGAHDAGKDSAPAPDAGDGALSDATLSDAGVDGGVVDAQPDRSQRQLDAASDARDAAHPVVVTAISGNSYHACALEVGGTVRCWGQNNYGQLGNGSSTPDAGTTTATPVEVEGLAGVTSVVAGFYHTCAIEGDGGTMKCWGKNINGELGNGLTTLNEPNPVPASVHMLAGVRSAAAGLDFTCALTSTGAVFCWGQNNNSQLGVTATPGIAIPNPTSITNATAIAAGQYHACAVVGGRVECWGLGREGQLGNGYIDGGAPTFVNGPIGVIAVAAGEYHTCVVVTGGSVECWGSNDFGQLGVHLEGGSPTPVVVPGLNGAIAIAASVGNTCALMANGSVECWGSDTDGELGNGQMEPSSSVPQPVEGTLGPLSGVETRFDGGAPPVAVGAEFACALLATGSVECWGDSYAGELGNGATMGSSLVATPVVW